MAGKIKEAPATEIMSPASMMIEPSDIEIPRINVVQKTSEIDAPFGSIVLDKQFVIAEPETAIATIPISGIKGWREDIPYDDDERPRIARSQEERDEIAKTSDYPMLEFADITMLFEKPDKTDVGAAYPFPIGDKLYALGRINVAKDAYRQTEAEQKLLQKSMGNEAATKKKEMQLEIQKARNQLQGNKNNS